MSEYDVTTKKGMVDRGCDVPPEIAQTRSAVVKSHRVRRAGRCRWFGSWGGLEITATTGAFTTCPFARPDSVTGGRGDWFRPPELRRRPDSAASRAASFFRRLRAASAASPRRLRRRPTRPTLRRLPRPPLLAPPAPPPASASRRLRPPPRRLRRSDAAYWGQGRFGRHSLTARLGQWILRRPETTALLLMAWKPTSPHPMEADPCRLVRFLDSRLYRGVVGEMASACRPGPGRNEIIVTMQKDIDWDDPIAAKRQNPWGNPGRATSENKRNPLALVRGGLRLKPLVATDAYGTSGPLAGNCSLMIRSRAERLLQVLETGA